MPLKLYPRENGIFHIRGTVQGRRVDESARTRVKSEAEAIRAKLEADLFKRAVYGDKAVATFAEAALAFMQAGGSKDHMTPLLQQIGLKKLSEVNQGLVDGLARKRPDIKPSTALRQLYAPVSAVMNFASQQQPPLCDPIRLRKPVVKNGRLDYLTPAEAETLLSILPDYLKQLVIFYLATGCRATEALDLQWKDVSPEGQRVVFWETKKDYPRGVDLQKRAVKALPERGEGPVFLNSQGQPWHAYDAINLMLKRIAKRHGFRLDEHGEPRIHCHVFRHTWATWAYACTRDLTFLMGAGGWRSPTMVLRYAHPASDDLARAVRAKGWEFGGTRSKRASR